MHIFLSLLLLLQPLSASQRVPLYIAGSLHANPAALKEIRLLNERENRVSYQFYFDKKTQWDITWNEETRTLTVTFSNTAKDHFKDQMILAPSYIDKAILAHSKSLQYRLELVLNKEVMPAPFSSSGSGDNLLLSLQKLRIEEPLALHQILKDNAPANAHVSRNYRPKVSGNFSEPKRNHFLIYRSTEVESGVHAFKFRTRHEGALGYGFRIHKDVVAKRILFASGGQDGVKMGMSTVSSMASRHNAILGINGSFFLNGGDPLGLVIQDSSLVSSPLMGRACFGLLEDGTAFVGHATYQASLITETGSIEIEGINQEGTAFGSTLFTHEFGKPSYAKGEAFHILIRNNVVDLVSQEPLLIPKDGVVVTLPARSYPFLNRLTRGKRAEVRVELPAPWDKMRWAMGGGPRLVSNHSIISDMEVEGFPQNFISTLAPRSGIGVDDSGNLILAVIDGRQEGSKGMNLIQFAECMKALGSKEAINLDGGGSTALWFDGMIVNSPSDGQERRVANSILLKARET